MGQQQQQRYKVIERIAAGGMAEVFRAESAGLEGFKKTVAIKRVLPHLAEKQQFMGMFLDEARLSAHLSHSNCVQVFDIGVGDNTFFIVMEFVDGADLKAIAELHRARGVGVPLEEACLMCVRICEGLSYAHELRDGKGTPLGIVHRDMSPPNVLITRYGEVKIVDFGLAKANSQLEQSEPGIIKGKFSYLAPEVIAGAPADTRVDIFAVGIILWELLSGQRLFLGESDLETIRMVQAARVPRLPNLPDRLNEILAKALAADPDKRYLTARDLGRDLNDFLFHSGRSVSSFDIAVLVAQALDRRREEKQRGGDKKSIISTLIDQVLIEFTSLQREEGSQLANLSGAVPLNLDTFAGMKDWSKVITDPVGGTAAHPMDNHSLEAGNLAALEDETSLSRLPEPRSNHVMPAAEPPTMSRETPWKVVVSILIVIVLAAAGLWAAVRFGVVPASALPFRLPLMK